MNLAEGHVLCEIVERHFFTGFMHASFDLVKYLVVILNDLLQFIFQLMMNQIVQQLFDFLYECAKSSFVFCGTRLFLF